MCTAFVRKGNDVIVGFNMDINIGAFEYKVFKEKDMFYIGVIMNNELELPEGMKLPYSIDSKNGVCKVHGVSSKGNFGNMLGYYGKDRYDIAMHFLRNSDDDFQVEDGLKILKATKQEGNWATRVSFVYSNNENAVYYCLEGDFEHVSKHQFI